MTTTERADLRARLWLHMRCAIDYERDRQMIRVIFEDLLETYAFAVKPRVQAGHAAIGKEICHDLDTPATPEECSPEDATSADLAYWREEEKAS